MSEKEVMDKDFYRSLLLLVNDIQTLSLLQRYVDQRIHILRDQLEKTKEHSRVLEIQGAIAELRRFATLREEVIKGAN